MIEYKDEKKRIFFEGVEVASFFAEYPVAEGLDRINSFVSELIESSLSWFGDILCERAREEYKSDESDKKRFYFKPYRYTLKIGAEEGQSELCLTLDATLCRGKREELAHFYDTLAFDTEKQIIKAPVKEKKKRK